MRKEIIKNVNFYQFKCVGFFLGRGKRKKELCISKCIQTIWDWNGKGNFIAVNSILFSKQYIKKCLIIINMIFILFFL